MVDTVGVPATMSPGSSRVAHQGFVRAGIQGGLLGGLAMLAFLALCTGLMGLGWRHALEAIGATVGATGAAAVVAGALLHAAVSVSFAVPFAALLPGGYGPGSAVVIGGTYGIFVAAVMTGLVVPAVSQDFLAAIQPAGGPWTIGHVVFGATVAVALVLRERAAPSASRPGATPKGARATESR